MLMPADMCLFILLQYNGSSSYRCHQWRALYNHKYHLLKCDLKVFEMLLFSGHECNNYCAELITGLWHGA